jgi:hypothetical protein
MFHGFRLRFLKPFERNVRNIGIASYPSDLLAKRAIGQNIGVTYKVTLELGGEIFHSGITFFFYKRSLIFQNSLKVAEGNVEWNFDHVSPVTKKSPRFILTGIIPSVTRVGSTAGSCAGPKVLVSKSNILQAHKSPVETMDSSHLFGFCFRCGLMQGRW